MDEDRRTANPADQATTPRERQTQLDESASALAEHESVVATAVARRALYAADAAARSSVGRIRASYYAEHPSATEGDFERDLPALMADHG